MPLNEHIQKINVDTMNSKILSYERKNFKIKYSYFNNILRKLYFCKLNIANYFKHIFEVTTKLHKISKIILYLLFK